jgi:hypothetical protein
MTVEELIRNAIESIDDAYDGLDVASRENLSTAVLFLEDVLEVVAPDS